MAACTNEGHNQLSLTQALESISQHGYTQTEALQEKQMTLSSLQVTLADLQKTGDEAEKKLRCKSTELLFLEGEMMHLKRQMQARHDQCASIRADNTKLLEQISEAEEKACTAQTRFEIYRRKMNDYRQAVLHASGWTLACKELEEKRALFQSLRKAKEELKEDLKNSQGNTARTAKREVDALTEEIAAMRKTIAERRENLQKELESHAQIKKDIEIQNKRFAAMVKCLHRQLSKAQALHRQMSSDVYRMERQIAELKMKLGSSSDSVVSDK
ncbi:uncharacterized protein LOC129189647 [Dunckerocampus dactyliophorus]|uniref:uncharacterized protein LOC129189647 n=1 Tax=Dunckerocampus dactyliophorus TaxID=161453 RepID=UPI002406DCE9|nr:uncharacterized protein LOC129189647 [Dunckerocampus dactyliophorus]